MRRTWPIIAVGLAVACGPLEVRAAVRDDHVDVDVRYADAFNRGLAAFRAGRLSDAASAFQEAYLIHPADPALRSWLALVKDEQSRRETMTRTLDYVKNHPPEPEREQELLAAAPDGEPWSLETHAPYGGFEETSHPLTSVRHEILDVGKRAGYQKLYKEGIGFQLVPGLGFSGRTEIYEEPNPIEALEMDAKVENFSELSQFRRSILPLSTRSAASRLVADYEPWPRLTYEYDARETLHQYQTRFAFKDIDLQTHAFNALYSFPEIPLLGVLTVNPWYKRVLQSSDHDLGSYEHRDELILNTSLQPGDNIEYFFQVDTFDSDKTRTVGGSKLKLYKGQVRLRVPSLKLFIIPSAEYSDTDFDPSDDEFVKRDFFVDWGFDIGTRWRTSSKEQWILTKLSRAGNTPSNPTTQIFNTFNKLSYELFKDFDVSFGIDYSKGAGFNRFDNIGLRAEVELFKPGFLRSRFGYEWHSYYNISEQLSLLYWRFFLYQ